MKVLFICKGNYFRSKMAEAIYNKVTNSHDATSAGTYTGAPDEPEGQVLSNLFADDSSFFKVMAQHGVNVRNSKTKKLTPEMLAVADVAVSMAEEPFVPDFLKNDKKVIWWNIANNADIAEETYEKLDHLIRGFIEKQRADN